MLEFLTAGWVLQAIAGKAAGDGAFALGKQIVEALKPVPMFPKEREPSEQEIQTALDWVAKNDPRRLETLKQFDAEIKQFIQNISGPGAMAATGDINIGVQNVYHGAAEAPAPAFALPKVRDNLPLYRSDFIGRTDDLADIEKELAAGPVAITQTAAITGLGGIGKTQTALAYAYRAPCGL